MKKSSVFDELAPWVKLEAHIHKRDDGLWNIFILDPIENMVHTVGVMSTEMRADWWARECLANIAAGHDEPRDIFGGHQL